MKKVILIALTLIMALSMAACGKDETVSNLTDDELVEKLSGIMDGKTGEMVVENYALSTLDDPSAIFGNWFNGMALPEGTRVAVNAPPMGSIAHVVLLIQPAEGTDSDDFCKDLEDNANPRWQWCVEADTVKSSVKDGLILFIMTNSEVVNADDVVSAFNG